MIILDTNVVSEMMRRESNKAVVAWLDQQIGSAIWITSVTELEVQTGIEILSPGRRKNELSEAFELFLASLIRGRVAAFDGRAARAAAKLTADRRRVGRPVDIHDTMIAGIALATGASLVTRNTRHFDDLSITLIDPWLIDPWLIDPRTA
jgi:predicted nucleic acid-binding protein